MTERAKGLFGTAAAPSRRQFLMASGAAAGTALLLGPKAIRPARGQSADRLIFGLSSYPPSILPWRNAGTASATVKVQIHRGLLGYDAKGNLRGEVAESWSSDGPTDYIVKLRPNAKFHDGSPVDAEAVRWSFDQQRAEKSTAYLRGVLQVVDRIDAVDKGTVRFRLKEPSATFPYHLASYHAHVVSPKSTDENNPIGAGPYRIADIERGTRIDLDAFPDYFRPGRPRSKKLRFVAYKDENLRVAALEAGDVHIIEYVPWQSMDSIEANQKLALTTVDGPFMYLVFNTKQGPFTNAKLRQAVAWAVKRDDIVKAAFFGRGSVMGGIPIPKGSPFYDEKVDRHWGYDPDRAKKLLAEGGMPNGFEATLLSTAQYGMHKDSAEVVQQGLASIGVQVKLNLPDWGTRVALGNRGQYDFAVMGSTGDFNDPDALTTFIGTQPPSYNRSFGFSSERIDALLAKGRGELDEGKRKAIYAELATVAIEEAPFVGLAWRSQGYALQKSVSGFANLPGFLSFYSGLTIEDVAVG